MAVFLTSTLKILQLGLLDAIYCFVETTLPAFAALCVGRFIASRIGGTGEFFSSPLGEYSSIIAVTASETAGRVPVTAGYG